MRLLVGRINYTCKIKDTARKGKYETLRRCKFCTDISLWMKTVVDNLIIL